MMKWGYIKEKTFYRPIKEVFIVTPRQQGKTTMLLEALTEDIGDTVLLGIHTNIVDHTLRMLYNQLGHKPVLAKRWIMTIDSFERNMVARTIKRLLIDEFGFVSREKVRRAIDFGIACGAREILCVSTLKETLSREKFGMKYFSQRPDVSSQLVTAEDLGQSVNVNLVMDGMRMMPKDDAIREFISGGIE